MVVEAFKYLTKIQLESGKAGTDYAMVQNRKRSAEIASFQSNDTNEIFPKQKKLQPSNGNSYMSIEYSNQVSDKITDSGITDGLDVVKIESICDSGISDKMQTANYTNEEATALALVDDENIETIDINLDKTAEMDVVNQSMENPESADKIQQKIKIPAPPDREILNSYALQRAGTLEDPYLVYVSPGVRKLSVNYYFLIGGELYYATKRHSMRFNDKFGPERHKITVQCSKSVEF